MQTFVAPVCTRCPYARRFLRKSRGRDAKALDNQNSTFVAKMLSLRRCFRAACSIEKYLTLRPVPGLLLQGPGQCCPESCAWLTLQNLRSITRFMGMVGKIEP